MQKKKVKLIINPTLPPHFIQSKTNGFYSLHVLFILHPCLFTMQTKMLMRIVLFWLISNCSHLKSSLIYYIFSEVFDGCCQESEPHIYQQRSLLLEKWRPDMNFFFKYINFFFRWAHSRPNNRVKEKLQFLGGAIVAASFLKDGY